jgi:cytochrome c2
MIFSKPLAQKYILTGLLFVLSFTTIQAQEGKALFQQNCQNCHALDKQLTGPALRGFLNRGPWGDRQKLYAWIHNPGAFIATDPYTQGLKAQYGVIMQAFP